jgi:hypothetical protein
MLPTEFQVILQLTAGRTVYPSIKPPSGIRDPFFFFFYGHSIKTFVDFLLLWGRLL